MARPTEDGVEGAQRRTARRTAVILAVIAVGVYAAFIAAGVFGQ